MNASIPDLGPTNLPPDGTDALDRALEYCLARLASGASLDAVLAEQPATLREPLRSLLDTADALRAVPVPALPLQARADMWAVLQDLPAPEPPPTGGAGPSPNGTGRPTWLRVAAFGLLVLFGLLLAAVSQLRPPHRQAATPLDHSLPAGPSAAGADVRPPTAVAIARIGAPEGPVDGMANPERQPAGGAELDGSSGAGSIASRPSDHATKSPGSRAQALGRTLGTRSSDPPGTASVSPELAGDPRLKTIEPKGNPTRRKPSHSPVPPEPPTVAPSPTDAPSPLETPPAAAAFVTGRVTDLAGVGIPNSRVRAVPSAGQPPDRVEVSSRTDLDGRYQLALAPGDYVVAAEATGFKERWYPDAPEAGAAEVVHAGTQELVLDFRLPPGAERDAAQPSATEAASETTQTVEAPETPVLPPASPEPASSGVSRLPGTRQSPTAHIETNWLSAAFARLDMLLGPRRAYAALPEDARGRDLESRADGVHRPNSAFAATEQRRLQQESSSQTARQLDLEAMRQFGGATNGVVESGGIAFVIVGARVRLFDLTNPGQPSPLGQTATLPAVPDDLAVEPGRLYVATAAVGEEPAHFWVFDVSDPRRPRLYSHCPLRARQVGAIQLWYRHALLLTDTGLRVVDIKDGLKPFELSSLDLASPAPRDNEDWTPAWLGEVATVGDAALVARPGGLAWVDLADARHPVQILPQQTEAPLWDRASTGLALGERYAYVAQRPARPIGLGSQAAPDNRLLVLDLDAPASQRVIRDMSVPAPFGAMVVRGGRLLALDQAGRTLSTFNLQDPERPMLEGAPLPIAPFASQQADLAQSGSAAWIALSEGGLLVVSDAQAVRPALSSDPILPPVVQMVSGEGGIAFAATSVAGLFAVAPEGTGQPKVVGQLAILDADALGAASIQSILLAGNILFVYTEQDGLLSVDVHDPTRPELIARLTDLPRQPYFCDMAFAAGLLYLPAGNGAIHVLDVTVPSRPRQIKVLTGFGALSLATNGTLLLATSWGMFNTGQLHVFDLAAPASPRLLRTLDLASYFTRLRVHGQLLYLTGNPRDMAIVDLGHPPAITTLGQLALSLGRVTPAGRWLYGADAGGLNQVGVHDPTRPTRWAPSDLGLPALPRGLDRPGMASDVVLVGGQAYVLRGEAGVFLLDLSGLSRPASAYLPVLGVEAARSPALDPPGPEAPTPQASPQFPDPTPRPSQGCDSQHSSVVLLIDTATAMADFLPQDPDHTTAFDASRRAVRALLDDADPAGIGIGLVRYDRQAERLPATRDRSTLTRWLDSLHIRAWPASLPTDGGRLDLALAAAADALRESPPSPDAPNLVLLFSGSPIDNATRPLALERARSLGTFGAHIHAVAVGNQADAVALSEVASAARSEVSGDLAAVSIALDAASATTHARRIFDEALACR